MQAKITRIFSKNAAYQKLEVLKTNRNKRYGFSQFFVEGVRNINLAIENNFDIHAWIYAENIYISNWAQGLIKNIKVQEHIVMSEELLSEISNKEDSSELMAIVNMRSDTPDFAKFSANPVFLFLDRPSNKGNLGTILRSCDALGVDGVFLTGHGVDLYDPDVISSTMGSFFAVPAFRIAGNDQVQILINNLKLRYSDLMVVGSTAHQEMPINRLDMQGPILLMIGNETDGLSHNLKEKCDVLATIPMALSAGASSFNIACAATVMLYEARRQRGFDFA